MNGVTFEYEITLGLLIRTVDSLPRLSTKQIMGRQLIIARNAFLLRNENREKHFACIHLIKTDTVNNYSK